MRIPLVTSFVRAKSFQPEYFVIFLDLSGSEMKWKEKKKKNTLRPNTLFNVDEIGLRMVQHEAHKMLATEGKKQMLVYHQHREVLITVVTFMSASCIYVLPLMVFLRLNIKPVSGQSCSRNNCLVGFKYTSSPVGSLKAPLALCNPHLQFRRGPRLWRDSTVLLQIWPELMGFRCSFCATF